MRWNTPVDWIISARPAHPPLVSEADFIAVQQIRPRRQPAPGRTYRLAGLLCCRACGRRMESHWVHQNAGYRCRHGYTSTTRPDPRTRNAYVREDQVLPHLPALHLRLTGRVSTAGPAVPPAGPASPPTIEQAIAHLRDQEISLVYDPAARTLTANTPRAERIIIG
jgi:site-specific DNA recombinase